MLHSIRGEADERKLPEIMKLAAKAVAFGMQSTWWAFDRSDDARHAGKLERRLIGLNAGVTERTATLLLLPTSALGSLWEVAMPGTSAAVGAPALAHLQSWCPCLGDPTYLHQKHPLQPMGTKPQPLAHHPQPLCPARDLPPLTLRGLHLSSSSTITPSFSLVAGDETTQRVALLT